MEVFAYDATSYLYEGAALKKAWPELHRGDCEPFPDGAFVKQALAAHPRLKCSLSADQAAAALQSAWRAYHRGDFGAAVAEGAALGPIGANAANKAANIYATYLETDSGRKREILLEAAARAEALQAVAPNFTMRSIFTPRRLDAMPRRSRSPRRSRKGSAARSRRASIARSSWSRSMPKRISRLAPITPRSSIRSVALLASLTYGATKEDAVKHFAIARKLLPEFGDRPHRGGERARHSVWQVQACRGRKTL